MSSLFHSKNLKNLIVLYFATLLMRAAFYITIATIGSPDYAGSTISNTEIALILAIYPIVELVSVSFFGSLCDLKGRKPILVLSLFLTAGAAFIASVFRDPLLLPVVSIMFGIGAASEVSSTLSIVADLSEEKNRAKLMGYYDLFTLMGLAGGYGGGIILLEFISPTMTLYIASAGALFAALVTLVAIKETKSEHTINLSIKAMIKQVVADKNVQKLVPVYVPVISLYGMFIVFTERILKEHFTGLSSYDIIFLFGLIGGSLVISLPLLGKLSDKMKIRRPFIVVGLLGFGALAALLISFANDITALWSVWPLLPIFAFMGGAFPPAALAYLTDISHEETRGTTMGVYSVFFGTGMIIGPITAGIALDMYGLVGILLLVGIYITIAIIGTAFMSEVMIKQPIENE